MLRLTPLETNGRLLNASGLQMSFAGAESNVAMALSQWGNEVEFVSAFPDNNLGRAAIKLLNSFAVRTSHCIQQEGRIGTYFIEQGRSIRSSKVIYDRSSSVFSLMEASEYPWASILEGAGFLHLTGITPALSPQALETFLHLLKLASGRGVKISFDPNFRRKLWADKHEARTVFDQVLPYIDLLITNQGALSDIWDMKGSAEELAQTIAREWKIDQIAFTHRGHHSASLNTWSGQLFHGESLAASPEYRLEIVDRFGGGDAFAAGLIHGLLSEWEPQSVIDFATAASALQQTTLGDHSLSTKEEIFNIIEGHTSGHVER